jgi:hypothetical protein
MSLKIWLPRAAIFAVCAVVTSVFFINLCSVIYACGCTSLWAGAAAHCNVHAASGKHCPWCKIGEMGQYGVYGSMLAAQALVSFWPIAWTWPQRFVITLLAFPGVGLVLGLVLGIRQGYWS